MTLTDYTSTNKGPPGWIEEDQIVSVQGHVGEDIVVELKLIPSDHYDDLRFELLRDGLPISSDRYQLSMRGNIVQLALKQSHKNDAGYYSLVATRLGQEIDKGALKKIHLSIDETTSYEEGEPPIFLRRLSDLAVKVGTRTRFLVEIRSATTPKITWYKNDAPIYEGPRFSLVHEGNFHCVDVAPVTIEDQGHWTCMVENRSGRSSCTSNFTVVVPKAYKRPEFIEELRALLTETGTVSLECKVVGVPTPVLRWFKDNKEIKAGDVFALTANPDDPTSLGVYTCEAVNCMGTAYSSSKVHVVGRGSREGSLKPADALTPSGPLPIFKQILQDECCRIGDTLLLSCRVQVPPWPKSITWYNKEGRIEPSEKYHVMEDGIGGYSIEVKQVEAVDEGEWKCVATSEENMKQITSCYVAMSIPRNYRKPRFMENLKAILTEEGLVSFECKVVGFPTPLLRWFKDGQELKPGDVYQLTGTNSLGSYCCIARNCMGEAKSTAELTIEDIQNQLNEEERFQLLSTNQPPKFIKGLRSCEARINEDFRFTIQVSIAPEPSLSWYRDDSLVDESDKYQRSKENLGTCHLEVRKLEFIDQAEWKCVAENDFGHSVTSCFLKLIIPKHYKKPKFLESLRAILSEEGAVNLECKVIGVPQPILKWYKDNAELKPGDIHRIISGQDGTCCLGTYTCEATNCMGTVSSSASLLGFEDKKSIKEIQSPNSHELERNLSLSTIHEERTSQLYDTPQTDHSVTLDERGEVSFSFDGKEVSVSLYETPDLTEEEALQIVEMYADQLSEHVTEHNVIELPPMRFVKETSTSGNLLMEAVVIDVSPDYFVSAEDDLRTEADFEDVSIMDDMTQVLSSPERDSRGSLKRSARNHTDEDDKVPSRPPRKKSMSISSSKSEKSQRIESESFHSAQKEEQPLSPLSSLKHDDSDTFADALSSTHLSVTESPQKHVESDLTGNRKRSLSAEGTTGSSLDDGIGGDSLLDSTAGVPRKKKQRKKKQLQEKSSSEEYSGPSDYEEKKGSELGGEGIDTKMEHRSMESIDKTTRDVENKDEQKAIKESPAQETLLNNLRDVKEAAPTVPDSSISILEDIREPIEDILMEPRIVLREALRTYENVADILSSRLFGIHQQFQNIYRRLETPREKDIDIEVLVNFETPLHALLKAISEITSAEDMKVIHDIFKPSIVQLLRVVESLELPFLQPTLTILRKIDESICRIPNGTEGLSSVKSISDDSRVTPEEIVAPLIDVQSTLSAIIDYTEGSRLEKSRTANGTTAQQALTTSGFVVCLEELKACVSHTAHAAMTARENETLNSLMEFRDPLLDLQLTLASEEPSSLELSTIKETIFAVEKLSSAVVTILKNSENSEAVSRAATILKILEDTCGQMSKLAQQLSEAQDAQKHILQNLNIDQNLSNVHFALSSVLEKREKHAASCDLIACIEALRQTVGSSAITIANLKNPVDDEITQEIGRLKESLLNLQRNLLTEQHEPEEEEILYNLMSPIGRLKEILHSMIESSFSVESLVPMLELLREIEKDAPLVAKEISKKTSKEQSNAKSQKKQHTEKSEPKSTLAGQINRSLDPIKHWLSATSEDSTKDDTESALSSTIEELKRDVTNIAIQTSYSEPPSDRSLIEALIDLREPLMRLKNAVSVYHEPEDLSALEGLSYPMKHLLQAIMAVLHEHAKEESLRSIVDIVVQIENQIPLSIKDALYQKELKQSDKTFTVETEEEEAVTVSRETIPGTLTEIASTPLEVWSAALATEQVTAEDSSRKIADDVAPQIMKDEKREREEKAGKLIMALSETLEKLQLEMTGTLEDFEEATAQSATIPQSKLANSLEELRRTISTIRVMTTGYGEEIESFEKKVNQTTLVLTNLLQPLTNIQKLLSRTHEHDVLELMILNRLTPLLNIIENDVIGQTIDFIDKGGDTEREFESLLDVLKEIKAEIPAVIQEISSKRKILECLRDISKPLESILKRMSDLEEGTEETLETDVAKILGKPTAALLKDIKTAAERSDMLDKQGPVILELRNLLEPLLEFHSCLSMVQSSRRSLVPEDSLLDERRNVILRAIDGLQKQVCYTVEAIANMEGASSFDESLMLLNSAILQVQKQIGKTDYSRRTSSVKISLQYRMTGTLNRLANTIITLEERADKDMYEIVSKCLGALQKQISLVQTQFIQTDSQSIDEEAIVEGFLYPTNQLLSALNVLRENMQQRIIAAISHDLMEQLRKLADSISEMSSVLSTYKVELIQEGVSETAPIVETFSAVIDVLDHVKDTIISIEKIAEVEQEASMVITKVEKVTDEIIEVSQEEIESVTMVTEILPSKAILQESAQLKIEDTTQMSDLDNLEASTRTEQTEDNLANIKRFEEKREENERQKLLDQENENQKLLDRAQISKFDSAIKTLEQPLRDLINFMESATQKSLISKSEEDKRKIRELTVLVQILYDLQATSASIKTVLPSSSIVPLNDQFRRIENILVDIERAIDTVTSITHEGVKPELKEGSMASLQSFVEPLDALESLLVSICQTIDENKYDNGEPLIAIAKVLISCIGDTVKSLNKIETSEFRMINEEETEISRAVKEETKDIEETTARPLEELIEAIMDSQEQVKCDKSSPFESSSPSADLVESRGTDDLNRIEAEMKLNEAVVEEADVSMTQVATSMADVVETPQQALASTTPSPIEELSIEKTEAILESLTKTSEEAEEEQRLTAIDQQKVELSQSSENDTMQGAQVKAEALRAIICPLQVVRNSLDEIGEIEVSESYDKKPIAFASLIEPLLNLELILNKEIEQIVSLSSENTKDIKLAAATLEKLSIAPVLEDLQKSIATIQEQVQLNTVAEVSSSETPQTLSIQAVEKPLKDLKMSIARIQSDSTSCEKAELSSAEQISVLQTLAKLVEEFGERFIPIISQLKIVAESVPPLQTVKQEEQKLDLEVLHKIIEPIHVLRETLSQIEDFNDRKIELLEIPEEKREIVQLNAVTRPLEKLEQSLVAGMQQIMTVQEDVTKELGEDQISLANANLKPVLEELKNSIVVIQQQAISDENILVKTLKDALECLKMPLTTAEEVLDEATETEKVSALLTFAKSVEETANQLVAVANQQIAQQEIREMSLLRMVTIPIGGLQSAILKLDDRISQTVETKESMIAVTLENMLQPLQQLQQSLLTASHQETALSLQLLPIKSMLDNLSKFVAAIQDQVIPIQDKLSAKADADDLATLKDFARSLGDLRTSTVVLQQLNAIENAGQQIIEIENASALQAFAKSIEEFRKCCSVVVERPKVIEAFATKDIGSEQSAKVDTKLLENIIAPLRILQEQILIVEETKMQQSEILDTTEMRKPVTVLSSLVGPLQQLERSFVATVQKEHVIEHEAHDAISELSSASVEQLALQPILEEVQKSIATVQEHVILEAGSHVTSETETAALLKSIAQPLVDLRASVASVQQVAAVAPDSLNELAQQQNVSALETFAETLHNLAECIATCNHQQIIIEPAADTISEDVSSLNTWADMIEGPVSKITCPMVIDQGAIESPAEIAVSIPEDEASVLKTLAKPLTELRECLALLVEERKVIAPNENVCSLSENENISPLKTMIQPLLQLKDMAAIIIQEQTAIERASEHSFDVEGNNELALRPLIEPLEELRHSIAVIQDQMLIETPMDRPKDDILGILAEPLFNVQRALSVLETRVISPDIESMPEDTSNNWIIECLATPLHEIERSIADIRQCTVMEAPETAIVEEQARTLTPDWSIVGELAKPVQSVRTAILRMEDDSVETKALRSMVGPLTSVQENLTLLTDKSYLSNINAAEGRDAIVESLSELEKCISFVEENIVDKPVSVRSDVRETEGATLATLNLALAELKCSIANSVAEESPTVYVENLERPLERVQDAIEKILSIQRREKLSNLSTELLNTISNINDSIESIKNRLEEEQMSTVVEVHIEYEALGMLTTPLQNIKKCIMQIREAPNTVDSIVGALQNLEKSIAVIREQSADKPSAESQHANFDATIGLSKNLTPCLHELQESIETAKSLWHEETVLEGLTILKKPFGKLQTMIRIIRDQFLVGESVWVINERKMIPKKKKKEAKECEIEATVEKDDKTSEIAKVGTEETKLVKEEDSAAVTNDSENKQDKERPEEREEKLKQKEEIKDKKSIKIDAERKEKGEIELLKKQEETETVKQTEKQEEKTDVIENKVEEPKKIIEVKKIKEDKSEQKDIENLEKIKREDNEQKEKKESLQKRKESDEYQSAAEDIGIKVEEAESKKMKEEIIKETKDTKKEEIQQEEEKAKEIKKVEQKDKKEDDKTKIKEQHKESETEKVKKKEGRQEKEKEKTDRLKEKEKEEYLKKEEVEILQKEKDKHNGEKKEIEKKEEQKILKENEKLGKDQEDLKNKENAALLKQQEDIRKDEEEANRLKKEEEQRQQQEAKKKEQERKKDETIEKIKEKKDEKTKDVKKTEEVKKEKEESNKQEETAQIKMQKEEQKKIDEVEKLKKEEAIIKAKEEEDEKIKIKKAEKLEEEKKESSKKEDAAKVKIEEEKKEEKNEIKKPKKEDEEQKQPIQAEEIETTENERAKTKKDMEEDKKKQKRHKLENKKIEKASEEQIEKKEEEIIKMEEKIRRKDECINEVKNENDIDENEQRYTEANEERERVEQEEKERMKQKQEEKLNKNIQELQTREDTDLRLKVDKDQEKQRDDRMRRQERMKSETFEDIKELKKEEECIDRTDKYKIWKEDSDHQKKYDNKRLDRKEIEYLEKKRTVDRYYDRKETDYFGTDKEMRYERSDEKRIKMDEIAKLLREEEQKLRKRREEEFVRNKQRREEQRRENEWSRKRENETDRFLKNMLEARSKSDKLTASFLDIDYFRDKRPCSSRFESGMPLSSASRSYSWRDSLTSLNRRRTDDYKLHDSFMDKYNFDAGSSYRRRRRRENRMIRARSISLLKYEDYSIRDSDTTFVPSKHIRPSRRTKAEIIPHINFDGHEFSSFSYGLNQSEDPPIWNKPKKPSFCTRLTNRVVGVGMRTRLTCTVLGNPEPRVHWTKDGQTLDASSDRYRTRFENGMAYLELHDALADDAGIYTCVAENTHGTLSTESTLKVYADYKPTHSPPTFVRSIKDTYRYSDHKLVLECRVRAYPVPVVSWLKDGEILQGERYKQTYLDDDVYRLEIIDPDVSDNGQYTCRAVNELRTEEISHMVYVGDREWRSIGRNDQNFDKEIESDRVARRPRFSNLLKDYNVPVGGTIALQVEVKGVPAPEVRWLRGDRQEPIAIPKARTFAERGLYTLIVPEATESERGTYVCRAINAYGQVDTSVTVDVIPSSAIDGGKPAMFVSRPAKKSIDVTVGEDVSISFRVNGIPKPRVTWMKGLTDITDGPRSYKESIDDYVRLTLKRAVPSDEGTYCILVKNRYGCDRCFFSIKVKQRARSLTPSPDWSFERDVGEEHDDDMSYVKNVPGPISSEPVAIDGGKNWLSLSWGKAERRGPAPVIAYKVDAWLLGSDGGARWAELGVTPINAFDAFNLRPGGEYKFRITPRNRYGWGEPVTMANSVLVSESTDLPEFTKILPGQLKALQGTPVKLECEVRGDPKMEVRWYRETTELDPRNDSRFAIDRDGLKCSLTIANVKEDDSGRYVCEANNKIGKVSSFARVLVVNDPRIIEADEKLRTSLGIEPEDRPPQFTMRIRDRRVQTTYPVRLTCQVIGHPVPEITWYKNGTEISQDDRHIFWDDDSNFHTLEIIHSTLDDSGCYMVTARNVNGSVSCRCTLVVDKGIRAYIAPEFLRGLDAAYTIDSGGELRMSAQLEAYPSVGVVWHRDGIRLRPSRRATMTLSHDGTVEFCLANATERDAGLYSCTATNAVGQVDTFARVAVVAATRDQLSIDGLSRVTSASPDIPYSKEPLFVTKPLSTEAIEGDTVVILCEVVGDPKPEVIWLRDFLKPDYYRDAPHFRLVGAGPQYRLEIPYAKLDFTGTYSVIARNCHGEAKAVISLQIYAKGQGKETQMQKDSPHGKVLTLPIIKRELRDLRCCDGDAVSLECKVHATPEPPLVRWERGGKIIIMVGDFAAEFDGETARLSIKHVYPEDEGEYTCVAYNDLGKAYTSACLVVDVPEGKESILSQRLTRPIGLLSAGSTPRSTPRSTPIRSLSPAVSHGRELRSPQVLPRRGAPKRPKVCPPKFYAVPHNRLVQEGETVRFQCAVIGHPAPWIRWDKNGTIVTPSARVSIKERDDIKILEIVDIMREDAALYRVTAENDFGRIEASARLEVISRHEPTTRTVRTRSASPRTYPSFERSLLPTTGRLNGRLQLECRARGTPGVTPAWYRNGRPLERSARIKRHFDGATAKIEISKVKASDAGEYTCVATNVLGSTRNSCQVTVLHPHDSSVADKSAPRFLQSLPGESIVMENHRYEFQTAVTGTPPFSIIWSKDGRELPDNDYYKYVVYGDGGVALRLSEVRPQDAGEYTCVVSNNFGVASCNSLLAVQDYKDFSKLAPQFTKTPLSVIAANGSTACFCTRVQCGKTMEIAWTINGKNARENAKCKIERDGNVSVLRIHDVSSRETGEIRCTASVSGKGPSISCTAKLQLQRLLNDLGDTGMTRLEDVRSRAQTRPSPTTNANLTSDVPVKVAEFLSSPKYRRRCRESPTRTRSFSFPRRTVASCASKHLVSPLLTRKRIADNASVDIRKSRFDDDPSAERVTKTDDKAVTAKPSNDRKLSSPSNEKAAIETTARLFSMKTGQLRHRDTNVTENYVDNQTVGSEPTNESSKFHDESVTCIECSTKDERAAHYREKSNEEDAEPRLKEPIRATIVKEPIDVTVFKGSRVVLRCAYRGRPEPTIKWLRVNRELRPSEKVGIVSGDGVSRLTLDDVTYDHAGKYEVSAENSSGKERKYFSLAVEGPPEPPADKPCVNTNAGRTTIVWRSPAYDGGRTVIGYIVEAKRDGESTWIVITESCHSLSHTLPTAETNFVIPGENYRFRVRAENIHGLSHPGIESELIKIPKQDEIMFQEEEDNFEPCFEARMVEPEERRLFGERYDVREELGKGRYGIVKKIVERATSACFAAKFVRTIKAKDREQVREEINIMNALRHPKLLLLAAAYESPRETVLVMEYISGGELFERVVADDFTLTERDSILFMRQICEGVEYMHKNKIVHLDLKPENIMCRTRTSHQIKLIDFGLAQTLKSDTPVRVLFGTPEFIPPEIINYEPIGTESDMWSVGVICYVLLTGLSPFMGDNDAETFANITRADYDLEDEAFDAVSNNAKDFISSLLIKRKELRMSAAQCLEHPWMVLRDAAMSRVVVLPTEKLKKFIIRRKWQKTGNAIRALGRMAILSAYNRRSPTATEESSPTLEREFDIVSGTRFDDRIESDQTGIVDESTERVETSTREHVEENAVETESQRGLHPSRATRQENTEIQKMGTNIELVAESDSRQKAVETSAVRTDDLPRTIDFGSELENFVLATNEEPSTREGDNSGELSKQIDTEEETPELDVESSPKDVTHDITAHLEISTSERNEESDKRIVEKSREIDRQALPKSRKVFRGDSRDSGIGDCGSSQVISPLQVDELGIVSTIEEEVGCETYGREDERTLRKNEESKVRRDFTTGRFSTNLTRGGETTLRGTKGDGKVATKSDVTKASRDINPELKVADESAGARILSGRNRGKFPPTGNVSRTARIFERESGTDDSRMPAAQRAYPAALITGKPYNERIQKAFAFWNK